MAASARAPPAPAREAVPHWSATTGSGLAWGAASRRPGHSTIIGHASSNTSSSSSAGAHVTRSGHARRTPGRDEGSCPRPDAPLSDREGPAPASPAPVPWASIQPPDFRAVRRAAVARERGARTVHEPIQGGARANTGARQAQTDVLVPLNLLDVIHPAMSDPACGGGAVDIDYWPRSLPMRLYLHGWRILARLTGMAQGATQFCRRCVFERVGGYDEKAWIGEDVDFYRGLKKFAKVNRRKVQSIRSPLVRPSCRRFDRWPMWRVLIWTNPLFISLFRRWKKVWSGWYSRAVR